MIMDNWLDGDFVAAAPNQKWAGDITYVWTSEGWLGGISPLAFEAKVA